MSRFIPLIIINFLLSYPLSLYAEETPPPAPAATSEPAPPPAQPATSTQKPQEKGLVFSISGEFDKYFFPLQFDFAMPIFKFNVAGVQVDFNDLAFNFYKELTAKGLEMANLTARAKKIFVHVAEEDVTFSLENLEKVTENQQDGDLIHSIFRGKFDRLSVPKQLTKGTENLNLRYHSTLEFRRLDANSLLELQKHVYELRDSGVFDKLFKSDGEDAEKAAGEVGGLVAMSMLGKLSEIAPKMMARSPEVVLNNFSLTSEKSELSVEGQAKIGIIADPNQPAAKLTVDPNVEGMAKFEVRIEKTLLNHLLEETANPKHSQEKVQSLVTEKLINDTGSHYEAVLTADYKERKLTMSKAMETVLQLLDSPADESTTQNDVQDQGAVAEAIALMQQLGDAVAQQYETTGQWTVTQKLSGATSGKYTAKIDSNTKQLFLQATLKGINAGVAAELAGETVRLRYDAKLKTWECEPGKPKGVALKDLPKQCQ